MKNHNILYVQHYILKWGVNYVLIKLYFNQYVADSSASLVGENMGSQPNELTV